MSGIQVVLGGNANPIPTAAEFARSLNSMAEEKKIVSFYAEDVTVRNVEWLQRAAKKTLLEPTQITSAVKIPTPIGPAIVSLAPTRTTPTTTTTYCSVRATAELLRALRAMEQQNARLPEQISREFAKAVKPLVDVHLSAA